VGNCVPVGDDILRLVDGDCDYIEIGDIYRRGPTSRSLSEVWWVKRKERAEEWLKQKKAMDRLTMFVHVSDLVVFSRKFV
jgi:hypothetical protein